MSTPKHAAPAHFKAADARKRSGALVFFSHVVRILFALAAVLASLELWLANTWAELTPDEILFHLRSSLAGTDTTVIWTYCLRYLPVVILACVAVFLAMRWLGKKGHQVASVLVTGALAFGVGGWALWSFSEMIGLASFMPSSDGDFVGENYTNPADVSITFPERKRNLIYIFLESMELTYADAENGGAFDENVIPELCELAHEGESFNGGAAQLNGGIVLPGTSWTMGGMFCQSSGVPLKTPFSAGENGASLDGFFPGLVTLGDILDGEGYHQRLLIGSDAEFGDRKEYYTEHRNFDILDYNQAIETGFIPKDYKVFWGFEDEKLFERARTSCTELAQADEPFNLTMLTVDTHFEDGYVCRLCTNEHGDDQYANVMSCSSRQVAEFVRWVQSQDFYENTTIILSGDHTTMDKNFCNNVDDAYQRRTFVAVINGAATPAKQEMRTYGTFDLFPTTLAALGCTLDNDRLGLGTNLYGTTPTLIEEQGLETCEEGFSHQSEFLNSYSNAKISDELMQSILDKCYIGYHDESKTGDENSGLLLLGTEQLNPEVFDAGRLVLTDTRDGSSVEYPLEVWRYRPSNLNKYHLIARVVIPQDELKYYTAEAYATVLGGPEQHFASWSGAEEAES